MVPRGLVAFMLSLACVATIFLLDEQEVLSSWFYSGPPLLVVQFLPPPALNEADMTNGINLLRLRAAHHRTLSSSKTKKVAVICVQDWDFLRRHDPFWRHVLPKFAVRQCPFFLFSRVPADNNVTTVAADCAAVWADFRLFKAPEGLKVC